MYIHSTHVFFYIAPLKPSRSNTPHLTTPIFVDVRADRIRHLEVPAECPARTGFGGGGGVREGFDVLVL